MEEAEPHVTAAGPVEILFHPSTVPIIDTFRLLHAVTEYGEFHHLSQPEAELSRVVPPNAAKAIVSDAVLLAFALGRQRGVSLEYMSQGSRRGTADEYCLMALIGASRDPDSELAFEAAAALRVSSLQFVMSLATDLCRQIDLAQHFFETPNIVEFRAIVSERLFFEGPMEEIHGLSGFKFQR